MAGGAAGAADTAIGAARASGRQPPADHWPGAGSGPPGRGGGPAPILAPDLSCTFSQVRCLTLAVYPETNTTPLLHTQLSARFSQSFTELSQQLGAVKDINNAAQKAIAMTESGRTLLTSATPISCFATRQPASWSRCYQAKRHHPGQDRSGSGPWHHHPVCGTGPDRGPEERPLLPRSCMGWIRSSAPWPRT